MRPRHHHTKQLAIRLPAQLLDRLDGCIEAYNSERRADGDDRPPLTRSTAIRHILANALALTETAPGSNHHPARRTA